MGPRVEVESPEPVTIQLTTRQAFDVLAAVELSPLDDEVVLQKLLSAIYSRAKPQRTSRSRTQ